jgi:hypothetical protein
MPTGDSFPEDSGRREIIATNKNRGINVVRTNVFILQLTTSLAKVGHHRLICEEFTNDKGIHIKLQYYYKFKNFLVKLFRMRPNTLHS